MLISTNLLDGALGTAFFERLLGFFDFTLRLAREDGERHVGDGILRFLQAQVGEATHNLNDRDALIGVNVVNDKVELGLFFGGFAPAAGPAAIIMPPAGAEASTPNTSSI